MNVCHLHASIDSVLIAERDSKNGNYASVSPINSTDCLEANQVILVTNSIIFVAFVSYLI